MRGCIFDIKRYAIHDGPGIRTTVFLKGCNLHCRWCHNPESQSCQPVPMVQVNRLGDKEFREERIVGYSIGPEELVAELQKDRVFYEESGGGVTFSGGEPLLQQEFLAETLRLCRESRLATCVDTAGAVTCGLLENICRFTDLFLYDIKTAEEKVFSEYIGQGYDTVWENLEKIVRSGKRVIIRIPVIPGVNNSIRSMEEISKRLVLFPSLREVELLPYHRTGADKYRRLGLTYGMGEQASLTASDLAELKTMFLRNNYHVL